MEILFEPAMSPFMISLGVLIGLVALEVLLLVLGADLFHFVDDLIPDLGEADAPEALSFAKALAFIGVGKVPVIMVLMSFLGLFGLSGFLLQNAAEAMSGTFLPLAAATSAAAVASLLGTGRVAAMLARILPSEETSAVNAESLIGRTAIIVYGDASHSLPATAKVDDQHGNAHHIQIKASAPEELFLQGQHLLIVSRSNGFYIGTSAPETSL